MAEPTSAERTVKILNLGEGSHTFEVPRLGPDGKIARGPSRTEDRGEGRSRSIPGEPKVDMYHLAPRAEPEAGGAPSQLHLTPAEFDRLAKDTKMGPLLRDLVAGERPEVMLIGAQLPAAA